MKDLKNRIERMIKYREKSLRHYSILTKDGKHLMTKDGKHEYDSESLLVFVLALELKVLKDTIA